MPTCNTHYRWQSYVADSDTQCLADACHTDTIDSKHSWCQQGLSIKPKILMILSELKIFKSPECQDLSTVGVKHILLVMLDIAKKKKKKNFAAEIWQVSPWLGSHLANTNQMVSAQYSPVAPP